jgi:hypothetical protein
MIRVDRPLPAAPGDAQPLEVGSPPPTRNPSELRLAMLTLLLPLYFAVALSTNYIGALLRRLAEYARRLLPNLTPLSDR